MTPAIEAEAVSPRPTTPSPEPSPPRSPAAGVERRAGGGFAQAAGVAAGAAVGAGLGAVFAVTALLRRSKPLHPNGQVAAAQLRVSPAPRPSGSSLLDEPGSHECLVRASYAIGTGPHAPDIEGFALRVQPATAGGAPVDLLFASTGSGPLGRFVLVVRPRGVHAAQTTLLPVQAPSGPLLLRLLPVDPAVDPAADPWPTRYRLSWATGRGAWQDVGVLDVSWAGARDRPERFDPVGAPLPGTNQYPAIEGLREPAYALARLAWPITAADASPRRRR